MSEPPAYRVPVSPKAPMWITPEERSANITKELKIAAKRFLCPTCGTEFSLFQSRAIACKYCSKANQNCPFVRCPRCDTEYPLEGFIVPDKEDRVHMNQYADTVFNNFDDTYNRR